MSIRFQKETTKKNKAERRALLEADDNPQYRKACQKHMKDSQDMRNSVSIEALKMFGTNPKVYNQASTYYRKNQQQAKRLVEIAKECSVQERSADSRDLTMDQALACLERIEDARIETSIASQIAIKAGKLRKEHQGAYT